MVLFLLGLQLSVELPGQVVDLAVMFITHLINLSLVGLMSIFKFLKVLLLSLGLVLLELLDLLLEIIVLVDQLILVLVVGLSINMDLY
jgi:hypothetical protein